MIPNVPCSRPARAPVVTAKAPAGLASLEPVAATKSPPARASRKIAAEAISTPRHAAAGPGRARLLAWGGAAACVALLGAAVAATVSGPIEVADNSLSARIASGTPKKRYTDSGKLERWRKRHATVHIGSSVDALGPHARKAIRSGFDSWQDSGAELPKLVFRRSVRRRTEMVQDGKNTVSFAPIDIEGHRRDLALTISYARVGSGEIIEADIIINSRHPFAVMTPPGHPVESAAHVDLETDTRADNQHSQSDREWHASSSCTNEPSSQHLDCGAQYDLQNVVAHEAGHFFGLGEDETDRAATMFHCTGPCETHKRSLEPSDVIIMGEVYGDGYEAEADVPTGGAGCSGARVAGSAPSPSPPKALVILALLGAAVARRQRPH